MLDDLYYYALKDLIEQGYEGQELLEKFQETQKKIKSALARLLEEAEKRAESVRNNPEWKDPTEEIFSDVIDDKGV